MPARGGEHWYDLLEIELFSTPGCTPLTTSTCIRSTHLPLKSPLSLLRQVLFRIQKVRAVHRDIYQTLFQQHAFLIRVWSNAAAVDGSHG